MPRGGWARGNHAHRVNVSAHAPYALRRIYSKAPGLHPVGSGSLTAEAVRGGGVRRAFLSVSSEAPAVCGASLGPGRGRPLVTRPRGRVGFPRPRAARLLPAPHAPPPALRSRFRDAGSAMSRYVDALWPGSPRPRPSPRSSDSGGRTPSRSSRSSASSRSSSRSRRGRSGSRSRLRPPRQYRRYSRSFSRSRSRSGGFRFRARRDLGGFRRSPRRGRSRSGSRSRRRSWGRGAPSGLRGRRCYGFGRPGRPEEPRRWRRRSRTRSRSRTPFRLSEKDRMELLEIAKANAAKALGTASFDLPANLRAVSVSRPSLGAAAPNAASFELSEKLTEDSAKSPGEKTAQQKSIAFSSKNSIAKPMPQKSAKATADETSSRSPKINEKKSPYGLWVPV